MDPEKYLRRLGKMGAPEAGGAAVVDACANLVAVYDALSLNNTSGDPASEHEYAVSLEVRKRKFNLALGRRSFDSVLSLARALDCRPQTVGSSTACRERVVSLPCPLI